MPIDFEDARDRYSGEALERTLRTIMQITRAEKVAMAILAHDRWERHWRTRLARWLRKFATQIELPEPVLASLDSRKSAGLEG